MEERRAHPRHHVALTVTFRDEVNMRDAITRDLSRGGCAIVSPRIRLVNERVTIGLVHPASKQVLEIPAEVKRAVPLPDGTYVLGVQFVDVDDATRQAIAAFLDSVVSTPAGGLPALPLPLPGSVIVRAVKRPDASTLHAELQPLLARADGHTPASVIARESGMETALAMSRLAWLVERGFLEAVSAPPGWTPPAPPPLPKHPEPSVRPDAVAPRPRGAPGSATRRRATDPRVWMIALGALLLLLALWRRFR